MKKRNNNRLKNETNFVGSIFKKTSFFFSRPEKIFYLLWFSFYAKFIFIINTLLVTIIYL